MTFTDQIGNRVTLKDTPNRIVSLVPSQTEFLCDLGLEEKIVGITRFCTHPQEKTKAIEKIGGTKQFDIEKIMSLRPDLIIGNKEENYESGITELKKHFSVWMSDIYTLEDNYAMMRSIAKIMDRKSVGEAIIAEIQESLFQYQTQKLNSRKKHKAAYFIWRKPYMVAANNTFIHHMLEEFGVENVFQNFSRYPEIEPEMLSELKPAYIFLSSEPYAFKTHHIQEFRNFSPSSKVILVDGEMFSWYGSRLRYTAAYFKKLNSDISAH